MARTGPRLVLVGLLALLVALGLNSRLPSPAWHVHSKLRDIEVAGPLEVVAVTLLLAVWARQRKANSGDLLTTRLRIALRYVLGLGAVALALTSLLLVTVPMPRAQDKGRVPPGPQGGVPRAAKAHLSPGPGHHLPGPDVFLALVGVLLAVAIVAISVNALRHSRGLPVPELKAPAEEYGNVLQEALLGGRRALLQLDDARAAIIACYRAMEESLARAGTTRLSAETPDELLVKAAATLSAGRGAAKRLTSLFYEARFSSHPLVSAQKDAAEKALGELAAQLGGTGSMGTEARS